MSGKPNMQRAEAIFEDIKDFWASHGISPTFEELSNTAGISKSVVYHYVGVLERRGLVTRVDRSARSIVVVGSRWLPPATGDQDG